MIGQLEKKITKLIMEAHISTAIPAIAKIFAQGKPKVTTPVIMWNVHIFVGHFFMPVRQKNTTKFVPMLWQNASITILDVQWKCSEEKLIFIWLGALLVSWSVWQNGIVSSLLKYLLILDEVTKFFHSWSFFKKVGHYIQ